MAYNWPVNDNEYISKITSPTGDVYYIKDGQSRSAIDSIADVISGLVGGEAVLFLGVTTSAVSEGGSEIPTISGKSYSSINDVPVGGLVIYGSKQYILDVNHKWREFGDLSTLGALAYASSATGSATVTMSSTANYTPSGTVSQPTFSGNSLSSTGTFKPAGTVSQPTFSGNELSSTANYTPAGSISITTASSTNKTAAVTTASGTSTYTPAGTVTAPTISVKTAGGTTTVKVPSAMTNVASNVVTAAPSSVTGVSNPVVLFNVDATNENLKLYQIGYETKAAVTTTATSGNLKNTDPAYQATAPTFSGSAVRLVTGNIPVPTGFNSTFTGTAATITAKGTPSGTVSQPTFTGTSATGNITVTGTPSGTVSQPTFNGTEQQVTVNGSKNITVVSVPKLS